MLLEMDVKAAPHTYSGANLSAGTAQLAAPYRSAGRRRETTCTAANRRCDFEGSETPCPAKTAPKKPHGVRLFMPFLRNKGHKKTAFLFSPSWE